MNMRSLKTFIFYNNTIPIMFGILFLGAGATFAASPEAREAIVSSETGVVSVDNSYLLNTTITDSTVGISIGAVREDDETYYVEYQLTTIGVVDSVWQPTTETKIFDVPKSRIVGMDLGLYVAEELGELHTLETQKLRDFQTFERRQGVTPKVVATEYSGLIGNFLEPQAEVFPAYNPLIDPAVGVPLSREEEQAHEAVQRLLEEERRKQERQGREASRDTRDDSSDEPSSSPDQTNPSSDPVPTPEPTPETPTIPPEPEPIISSIPEPSSVEDPPAPGVSEGG